MQKLRLLPTILFVAVLACIIFSGIKIYSHLYGTTDLVTSGEVLNLRIGARKPDIIDSIVTNKLTKTLEVGEYYILLDNRNASHRLDRKLEDSFHILDIENKWVFWVNQDEKQFTLSFIDNSLKSIMIKTNYMEK